MDTTNWRPGRPAIDENGEHIASCCCFDCLVEFNTRREESEKLHKESLKGYVYILTNPAFPDLVKIGQTQESPEIRAKSISSATGVPYPFKVAKSYYVTDRCKLEKHIHGMLKELDWHVSKEFFRCGVIDAHAIIVETIAWMQQRGEL